MSTQYTAETSVPDGKEYESNRIDEGYELYLKDIEELPLSEEEDERLILRENFMDNPDYAVSVSMPCTAAKGQAVKLVVCVRKKSDEAKDLYFHARLQIARVHESCGRTRAGDRAARYRDGEGAKAHKGVLAAL